jgi:hypothetical protein
MLVCILDECEPPASTLAASALVKLGYNLAMIDEVRRELANTSRGPTFDTAFRAREAARAAVLPSAPMPPGGKRDGAGRKPNAEKGVASRDVLIKVYATKEEAEAIAAARGDRTAGDWLLRRAGIRAEGA